MNLELVKIAYIYIQKYTPVEETRDRAIQQTVDFCLELFPSLDKNEVQQSVEYVWKLHIERKEDQGDLYTSSFSLEKDSFSFVKDESVLGEINEESNERELIETTDFDSLRKRFPDLLSYLDEREKRVVELRFGMKNGYIYTPKEISKIFGVTHKRVHQLERSAFLKLKDHLK